MDEIFYLRLIIMFFLIFYYIFFAIDSVRMQSTATTSLAMAYTLMALMTLMMMMNMLAILTMSMRNMLAILMLFHLDIPNISLFHLDVPNIALFPSMMMNLVDLVTRNCTPCRRSIIDVYILLHDPCLITRNQNLRLKEKNYIHCLYTLSDRWYIATR